MMKTILIALTCLFFIPLSSYGQVNAEEKIDKAWIKHQAFKVAKEYANSIACNTSTQKKNLIALRPWNTDDDDDRGYAKYALIWHGDIGCNGGSGSYGWYIAMVQIGAGNSFFIDPAKSSPMIHVQLPIKPNIKIVKFSESTITVRTQVEEVSSENGCCDSIVVDLKLKTDKHGNWNLVSKKKLQN